jgi:hypothetical protein
MSTELARIRDAYVNDALEHREVKAALQARLKQLEADLSTAKGLVRQMEYEREQGAGGAAKSALAADNVLLEQENAGLRKRVREYEAAEEGHEGLRKRLRELEAVEKGFNHLRAVFASAR